MKMVTLGSTGITVPQNAFGALPIQRDDFDKMCIRDSADCAHTEGARGLALRLHPSDDPDFVRRAQRETSDAKKLIGLSLIHIYQDSGYFVSAVMPLITEGDVTGSVVSLIPDGETASKVGSELESKLIQTAAGFLSKQLES